MSGETNWFLEDARNQLRALLDEQAKQASNGGAMSYEMARGFYAFVNSAGSRVTVEKCAALIFGADCDREISLKLVKLGVEVNEQLKHRDPALFPAPSDLLAIEQWASGYIVGLWLHAHQWNNQPPCDAAREYIDVVLDLTKPNPQCTQAEQCGLNARLPAAVHGAYRVLTRLAEADQVWRAVDSLFNAQSAPTN